MARDKESTIETAIRVVTFSGRKDDWITWDEKFQARARRRGYGDILLGDKSALDDANFAALSESDSTHSKQLKLRQLNELAFDDLILSMETGTSNGKVAFNLVRSAKNRSTFKHGDAALAYKRLKHKYAPETAPRSNERGGKDDSPIRLEESQADTNSTRSQMH
jgi:hypothetical protein